MTNSPPLVRTHTARLQVQQPHRQPPINLALELGESRRGRDGDLTVRFGLIQLNHALCVQPQALEECHSRLRTTHTHGHTEVSDTAACTPHTHTLCCAVPFWIGLKCNSVVAVSMTRCPQRSFHGARFECVVGTLLICIDVCIVGRQQNMSVVDERVPT